MKKIFLVLLLSLSFSLFLSSFAWAQETSCDSSEVTLVFRNAEGDFLPNMNFAIYTQVLDADNNYKPDQQVASGRTDAILGRAKVFFTSKESNFVIKVWDKNKTEGSFYFYNDLQICGGETEITEYLSAFKFTFRDTEQNLIKNTSFSLFTQDYDADGEAIKQKKDLVARLNTGEYGVATIYVPDSSRSIDAQGSDYYVLEAKAPNGRVYQKFNLSVSDGDTTNVDYIFSKAIINLQDKNGIAFPADEKIEVYQQDSNDNDDFVLGKFIEYIVTNDAGQAVWEYPAGIYALKIIGQDKKEFKFFNIEIIDNEQTVYDLSTSDDWKPNQGACDAQSSFTLKVKNQQGQALSGIKYELFEQDIDLDGQLIATNKKINGEVDITGQATKVFNPDPRKKYVLKLYRYGTQAGAFWYFNEIQFVCGQDISIEKQLSSLQIILRTTDGNLVKNKRFSIYTQNFDVDGFPIKGKKDLVSSSFTTSDKGVANIFLPAKNEYDKSQQGLYVLEVVGENSKKYIEYDIKMNAEQDIKLEYIFSDVIITLQRADQEVLANQRLSIYQRQYDAQGNYILGKLEQSLDTDSEGKARFALPAGFYVLQLKDSLGQDINFWYLRVANRKRNYKNLTVNLTKVFVHTPNTVNSVINKSFNIYALKKTNSGKYERDIKIKTFRTDKSGYKELTLASQPYLFVVNKNKKEYGQVLYADSHQTQAVNIYLTTANLLKNNQQFSLVQPLGDIPLSKRLAGKILLQVERNGEAWYVDTDSQRRYYMKDGDIAYEMMRKFGLGISNANLAKIPIGLDERLINFDYDGDLLSDKIEEAIGTDMYDDDSDDDGYNDGEEIQNGFDPLSTGTLSLDQGLADKLRGHIVLQVESRGEAWYINPADGKRYYMKDGNSAYEIMRFLSLGITNENLEEIEIGSM